jgi:hypothetical protein
MGRYRVGVSAYLNLGVMFDGRLSIDGWDHHFENTIGILLHRMRLPAPLVYPASVVYPHRGSLLHRREKY